MTLRRLSSMSDLAHLPLPPRAPPTSICYSCVSHTLQLSLLFSELLGSCSRTCCSCSPRWLPSLTSKSICFRHWQIIGRYQKQDYNANGRECSTSTRIASPIFYFPVGLVSTPNCYKCLEYLLHHAGLLSCTATTVVE